MAWLLRIACKTERGRFSRTKRKGPVCKKCDGELLATEEHVLSLECRRCYAQKLNALPYLIELLKSEEVFVADGCTLPDILPLLQDEF